MQSGELQQGILTEVTQITLGSETATSHASGATQLQVYDTSDFSEEGGYLKILIDVEGGVPPEPPEGGEVDPNVAVEISHILIYSTKNDDTNFITLVDPLPEAIDAETQVFPLPLTIEKWAQVLIDDDDEAIVARIPYTISPTVETGIRGENEYEGVTVQLQGMEYVVVDMPGKADYLDFNVIDPDTVPDIPTDPAGDPITTAPVLTLDVGLRAFALEHTQVGVLGEVFYELHMGKIAGFTPNEATLYKASTDFVYWIKEERGGAPLSTTDPYYFKVRAFTRLVAGPWSNEVSGTALAGLDPAIIDELNNEIIPQVNADLDQLNTDLQIFATDKANTAQSNAISTASTDATNKANTAQTNAISTASADATAKANAAQAAATTAAQTKADAAQAAAIAAAATDASNKANTAYANAKILADAALNAPPNLALNSSFESDITGQVSAGVATVTYPATPLVHGTRSMRLTRVATGDAYATTAYDIPAALVQNKDVTVSFTARASAAATYSAIQLQDTSGAIPTTPTVALTTTPQRYSITYTAAQMSSANNRRLVFRTGASVGNWIEIDAVKVEVGTVATAWSLNPQEALAAADAAKTQAIAAAAADATAKANAAEADAIAAAATDASNKANAAEADAIAAAATDATTKANNATTSANSFTTAQFPIGSTKILDDAVITGKIFADAITTPKILVDAVNANKIVANAVTSSEVNALAVLTEKLNALAVNTEKIAATTVVADKIATDAVTTAKLASEAVTATEIASNAITTDKLDANAITAKHTITGAVVQTAASGTRVVLRSAANPAESNSTWGLIEVFNQHGWQPGRIWGSGTSTNGQLRISSPHNLNSTDWTRAAAITLNSDSSGFKYMNMYSDRMEFTATTFYYSSSNSTSIDFRLYNAGGKWALIDNIPGNATYGRFNFQIFGGPSYQNMIESRGYTASGVSGALTGLLFKASSVDFHLMGNVESQIVFTGASNNNAIPRMGSSATFPSVSYKDDCIGITTWDASAYHTVKASSFSVSSDVRHKTNEVEVAGALELVKKLKVYDYDTPHGFAKKRSEYQKLLKEKDSKKFAATKFRQRGVMAQDLQKLLPDAVNEDDIDDEYHVDLYSLLATSLAAIKDLAAQVEELSARVN